MQNATICVIVCDRGDRYLSTGVFSQERAAADPRPASVDTWPSAVACLAAAHPAPHVVVFTADEDESGVPWCGDCARALPPLRDAVRFPLFLSAAFGRLCHR